MKAIKLIIRYSRVWSYLLLAVLAACASARETAPEVEVGNEAVNEFGVIVMAHGGSAEWNSAVEASLGELSARYPVEIAFGMADAGSLENAVRSMESQGVTQAAVVRLFVSGESWYERTSQILGIEEGAPVKPAVQHAPEHTGMAMGFWKIDTDIEFYMSDEGLAEAEEMDQVLLSRVRALSVSPNTEVVAVIAHGPATDEEDRRWISEISERTELLKRELQFSDVRVFTLREDWEEKREGAEELIRNYLQAADSRGLTPIVVPFRVQGFGPYASVLDGLDYRADQLGLTPHANVALWIENQADTLQEQAEQHRLQLAQTGRD